MHNAGVLLCWAREKLAEAGVENAALDARVMLSFASGIGVESLLLNPEMLLQPAIKDKLEAMICRRIAGEPVAYITGYREFWGLDFVISRPVLIPRPDTETLVELVLNLRPDKEIDMRIADFGTGSGCIIAALLHEYKNAAGIGLDMSEDAVAVASANMKSLGLSNRAEIISSNWDSALGSNVKFDLVVSNPPYIESADIADLMKDVRDFEPHLALDGGADGLAAYREIAAISSRRLNDGGLAAIEAGHGQADDIRDVFAAAGLRFVASNRDLQGIERALAFANYRCSK